VSNSDREFIAQAFPNANLTPATNKVLLDVAERVQDRKIALEEMRADWIERNGSLRQRENGKTFAQATAELARTNIVSPEEKAAIKSALGGEPPPEDTASLPTFNTPEDVRAAVRDGRIKPGDTFLDANGKKREVSGAK
jgi:hypothetical protein